MENPGIMITLILKAVAMAMAVATVVIGSIGGASVDTLITLLGIGLFTLALAALQSEESPSENEA